MCRLLTTQTSKHLEAENRTNITVSIQTENDCILRMDFTLIYELKLAFTNQPFTRLHQALQNHKKKKKSSRNITKTRYQALWG